MKYKYLMVAGTLLLSLSLLSWGVTGHRTIGKIAENHMTAKAKTAITELIGDSSLAQISTYADEIRSKPEYRSTGSWHFINLPLGLSFHDFKKQVKELGVENVYGELLKFEGELKDPNTTKEEKIFALKFVVHLVGDLHQPMHVSRESDQGGNKIQVTYDGKGTNLHSLWDTRLLEHQKLGYDELAAKYDVISNRKMKAWQRTPMIKWVYESYQASSILYKELEERKDNKIDEAYYNEHIPLVELRIQQAGIRLAGVLNRIYR
jgi:hypothetical protein